MSSRSLTQSLSQSLSGSIQGLFSRPLSTNSFYHNQSLDQDSIALFQVKWKAEDSTNGYEEVNLKGSIDLLHSKKDPKDYQLCVKGPKGTQDVLPLPAGVDWRVSSEVHPASGFDALVIRLNYRADECKIKIRMGLPLRSDSDREKASQFRETLRMGNLQSGVPQEEEMECRMDLLPLMKLSLPLLDDEGSPKQSPKPSEGKLRVRSIPGLRSLSPQRGFPQAA